MTQKFVTLPREVVEQGLRALEYGGLLNRKQALAALRAAMEQPQGEQEPMFWYRPRSDGLYEGPLHKSQIERVRKESGGWVPLYTNPQPNLEPPTDAEIGQTVRWLYQDHRAAEMGLEDDIAVASAIEAAHNIK